LLKKQEGMNKEAKQPDEQLGYLLTQVSFLKQRITNAALKEIDITYVQFIILAGTLELGMDGYIVTQQTISLERRLDKAMVSNVSKVLVQKGLLVRDQHPEDGRAFTLRLTPKGENIAVQGKKIALEIDKAFFAGVNQGTLQKSLKELLIKNSNRYGE